MEWLRGKRRANLRLFRSLYAAWLVILYLSFLEFPTKPGLAAQFVVIFIVQQFAVILLATPILTAGAITEEKERGTLQFLLSAGLGTSEIVLGKAIARLALLGEILVVGLPLLFFMGRLADLHLGALLMVLAESLLAACAIAALSLLTSVWTKQTRDAVLLLYALVALGFGLWMLRASSVLPGGRVWLWCDAFLMVLDPRYAWEPLWERADPTVPGWRMLGHFAAWLFIAAASFLLAAWRMRPAYFRQLEGPRRGLGKFWGWLARPPVGDDPVRWRERYVVGLASMPGMRYVPRWPVLVVVMVATLYVHLDELFRLPTGEQLLSPSIWLSKFRSINTDNANGWFISSGGGAAVLLAILIGMRCAEAINGEKEKGTWDGLLMTPLTGRLLVASKLWGVLAASLPYLAAYALPTLILAATCGPLAVVITLAWLAGTVPIMLFAGAIGLLCSATIRQTWQSILATLGCSLLGGVVVGGLALLLCWPTMAGSSGPAIAPAIVFAGLCAIGALVGFLVTGLGVLAQAQLIVRREEPANDCQTGNETIGITAVT
jgi:ABC-type transport system involved in multi-copper enzyme maturation permease subunit